MSDTPPSTGPRRTARPGRASSRPRRATTTKPNIAGLEDALAEGIGKLAMMQAMAGAVTGDERHMAGAEVTAEFAPRLASAWYELAKRNDTVAKVLAGGIENSVTINVAFATGGFIFAQAKVYGIIPDLGFINPLAKNDPPESPMPPPGAVAADPPPSNVKPDSPAAERVVVNPSEPDFIIPTAPDIPVDNDLMMAAANGGAPVQRPEPLS